MILLSGLLLILWGEPGRCLEEGGSFTFHGDFRHFAVATNTVYIATEERLYQLSHDLTLTQSLTQRGILKVGPESGDEQFYRVSETDEWNATFGVNILLPFVENNTVISCGVIKCGYCELLDLQNISNVLYREHIQVGPAGRSNASVGFLVDVEKTRTRPETYILTALQQPDKTTETSCLSETASGENTKPVIIHEGEVVFVDGFQKNSIIYLFSNVPSEDKGNKVRLIWLEGKTSKAETLRSLRGATLSISDGGKGSRLVASSVIPGGPPVLWSGVFSVDGGQTDTELVVFDVSPDLTGAADADPDFCITCPEKSRSTPKPLKPKAMLIRQNYMTSVLAVRQKTWMVFFTGTGDGQLIKLAVDTNYHTTCPRVLYRASDDRQVFPKILLDQVDRKHVYVPFQNLIKRLPVSKCNTNTNVQDCWSAQDPYCVWCGSKRSCTFEDECRNLDWLSIPDDSRQRKMVSYSVVKDSTGQITLSIQTHLTVGQSALSNFACQFSASSSQLCSAANSPPRFPQCTCVLKKAHFLLKACVSPLRLDLG
ncbi:plexin-C1-like [Micropterus salmoides]|uniref:plexin-C1-like n=1 Tax=Micropterus salmoides TaxID=27706 RepID=UPI0018EDFA44|nr:plexin-C1-like [Micropterus salmoides]